MIWTGLLHLYPDGRLLSGRDILNRLKLKTDIDVIFKHRVQQSRSDSDNNSSDLEALITSERDNFAANAPGYLVFLLATMLGDVHLTADFVHAMACFDPHVLVSLPMEQVSFSFNALFQKFCLRG